MNNKEYWISMLKYIIRHKKKQRHNEQQLLFKKWSKTRPTQTQIKKYMDDFNNHV
jgi:hypothetical protein